MVAVSSRASFVQETSTTTGTGTYDLAGAVAGFQGFVAGNGDGAIVRYSVTDGTDWEVCEGTITDAATDTLSRGTVLESSNSGAAVSWGAGTKTISQVMTPGEVCGKFLIERITLGSAGEFDFDAIPQIYKRLVIQGNLRGTGTGTIDELRVFFNEDLTAANYISQICQAFNGAAPSSVEAATSRLANVPGVSSTAGVRMPITVTVEDYASTDDANAACVYLGGITGGQYMVGYSVVSRPSLGAAITRLRFRADGHATDGLIGTLTLYGEL